MGKLDGSSQPVEGAARESARAPEKLPGQVRALSGGWRLPLDLRDALI